MNLKCHKKLWCVPLNCVSLHMCKWTDADRAQKHGMDEFISSNPCNFDHASLFEMVQRLTLDHRLNDSYSCLASISFDVRQLRATRRFWKKRKRSNIPLPLCQSSTHSLPNPFTILGLSLILCEAVAWFSQESMWVGGSAPERHSQSPATPS